MLLSSGAAILLFSQLASAQNSCYYAAGKRAGSAIVPCGPSGSQSFCCQIGDLCLSDSACWNPEHNVTYLYGCTDSTYQDPSCPFKCGSDFDSAPYVGLDYCVNTTSNEWSCTHPPSNSESIQEFPAQECYDDSIIAFAGPSVLQPILSLPTDVGGSTVWFSEVNPTSYTPDPNYTPTSTSLVVTASTPTTVEHVSQTATGTKSATSNGGGGIAGVTSTVPSSPATTTSLLPSPTSSSSSGLSTGAKAGIGAGVAVGVIGIIALIAAFLIVRRRKPKRESQEYAPMSQEKTSDKQRPVSELPSEGGYPADKKPRPPSELPAGATAAMDRPDDSGTGIGTLRTAGSAYAGSSTVSNFDSPAPTYTPHEGVGRPAGSNQIHELG